VRFGPVPIDDAVGAVAAHTVRAGDVVVKKGSALSADSVARLKAAGIQSLVAVRLDEGDVGEDEAALRLAEAVAGPHVRVDRPFTGRSNLFAERAGVLLVEGETIDGINGVDESITVATLPAHKPVVEGEMIGTVKIIPYAVPSGLLQKGLAAAGRSGALRVAPYSRQRVSVISTLLPGLKPTVVAKTVDVLGRRLDPTGAR
jgi:molybdenum cofactor cytidylyltransferase